jgi:hypothetical protein
MVVSTARLGKQDFFVCLAAFDVVMKTKENTSCLLIGSSGFAEPSHKFSALLSGFESVFSPLDDSFLPPGAKAEGRLILFVMASWGRRVTCSVNTS